jgi:hypothetical protein
MISRSRNRGFLANYAANDSWSLKRRSRVVRNEGEELGFVTQWLLMTRVWTGSLTTVWTMENLNERDSEAQARQWTEADKVQVREQWSTSVHR